MLSEGTRFECENMELIDTITVRHEGKERKVIPFPPFYGPCVLESGPFQF